MCSDTTFSVSDHVASVEIHRPPNNFFDFDLIREIADTYAILDDDENCRAIVLCSEGKHFCAGANFQSRESWGNEQLDNQASQLYIEAVRIFGGRKPWWRRCMGQPSVADWDWRFRQTFASLANRHAFPRTSPDSVFIKVSA